MSILRLVMAAVIGAGVLSWLPRAGVLAATQELIGFLSLLMAGLLPAMILTATILRGGGLSAKRIDEYGGALRQQLRFWAGLFGAAGLATFGIFAVKVFSTTGVKAQIGTGPLSFNEEQLTTLFVATIGAGLGVVLQRLKPAYDGLVSLLQLNVRMAKTEALAHDRSLREALEEQGSKVPIADPYSARVLK